MKKYIAQMVLRQRGTSHRIKLKANHITEDGAKELQQAFIHQLLNDPNRYARQELEGELESLPETFVNPNHKESK